MAAAAALQRGYAICATPRSGSNYLCRLLGSLEWFEPGAVRRTGFPDWPDDRAAQLQRIRVDGGSPNGVWGLKLFPQHFDFGPPAAWEAQLPGLRVWIWLSRRDLLGQAISLVRARQTQVWHVADQAAAAAKYSAEAIDAAIAELCAGDAQWRAWFARHNVEALRIDYEDLRTDAEDGILAAVCRRLEVPGKPAPDDRLIDVRRQRDELNAEWRALYLAGRGAAPSGRFKGVAT
jgi:trehalose 2-sulfotransferase